MDQTQTGQAAQGMTPMPKYRCHKEVWALKIKNIQQSTVQPSPHPYGSYTITPEDKGFAPFDVPTAFVERHTPVAGGYYVQYEGGYTSYSPAEAFEGGYTLIKRGPYKVGDLVNFSKASGNPPMHDPAPVTAVEYHSGDTFYRLLGHPGALFIASSLQ